MPKRPAPALNRPAAKQQRRPISRASLETIISRSVALFGLLFGAQALPAVISQRQFIESGFWVVSVSLVYGLLVLSLILSIVKRGIRPVNALFAAVFVLELALWVVGFDGAVWGSPDRPWLWFLATVAAAAAAVAFSVRVATAYLVLSTLLYGVLRTLPQGGSSPLGLVALDVLYAILLGGAVLIIITMLRAAAAAVEIAQVTAQGRYLHAVREHATEVERVQVDSIVHDTVLTAFLSAARADTPEQRAFAARLARNAIIHLRDAELAAPGNDALISVEEIAERLSGVPTSLSCSFTLDFANKGDGAVPYSAAEAIISATTQAMVNSSEHAGSGGTSDDPEAAVKRWVRLTELDPFGLAVEVGDTGRGFTQGDIPPERLGVRVSIMERMLGAGGRANIASAPGRGAVVTIAWPAGEAESPTVSFEPEATQQYVEKPEE